MTRSCCCTAALYIAVRGCRTWNANHMICLSVLESSLKRAWIFLLHTLPMGAASRYTSFSDGIAPPPPPPPRLATNLCQHLLCEHPRDVVDFR